MKTILTLNLRISGKGLAVEVLDELTFSLISELRKFKLDTVHRGTNEPARRGSKGSSQVPAGALVLGASPNVLPEILAFLQIWASMEHKVLVEAPNGVKVEIGPEKVRTAEELAALVERFSKLPVKK